MSLPAGLSATMTGFAPISVEIDMDLLRITSGNNQGESCFSGTNGAMTSQAISIRQNQIVIAFQRDRDCFSSVNTTRPMGPPVISSLRGIVGREIGLTNLKQLKSALADAGFSVDQVDELISENVLDQGTILGVSKEAVDFDDVEKSSRIAGFTTQYHGQMVYQNASGASHVVGDWAEVFIPGKDLQDNMPWGDMSADNNIARGQWPLLVRSVKTKTICDSIGNRIRLYLQNPRIFYSMHNPDSRTAVSRVASVYTLIHQAKGHFLFGLYAMLKGLDIGVAPLEEFNDMRHRKTGNDFVQRKIEADRDYNSVDYDKSTVGKGHAPFGILRTLFRLDRNGDIDEDAVQATSYQEPEAVVTQMALALNWISGSSPDTNKNHHRYEGSLGRWKENNPDRKKYLSEFDSYWCNIVFEGLLKHNTGTYMFGDVTDAGGNPLHNVSYHVDSSGYQDIRIPRGDTEFGAMLQEQQRFNQEGLAAFSQMFHARARNQFGVFTRTTASGQLGSVYRSSMGSAHSF